jgi:hypothetical protein
MLKKEPGLVGRPFVLTVVVNSLLLPAYMYAIGVFLMGGEPSREAWAAAFIILFIVCFCWLFHSAAGALAQTVAIATVLWSVIIAARALSSPVKKGLLGVLVAGVLAMFGWIVARHRRPGW